MTRPPEPARTGRAAYYTEAQGGLVELAEGQELLFSELSRGLRIVGCGRDAMPTVGPAYCQVLIEMPFPFGPQAMLFWGPEIIGYTPLIIDANISLIDGEIIWRPSKISIDTLAGKLRRRVYDILWKPAESPRHEFDRPSSPHHPSAGDDVDLKIHAVPLGAHALYLCLDMQFERPRLFGLVLNYLGPNDYVGFVIDASEDDARLLVVEMRRGHFAVHQVHPLERALQLSVTFDLKLCPEATYFRIGGVVGVLSTGPIVPGNVGLIAGHLANRFHAVYPTHVDNLLFSRDMITGHYQDRRTIARLVLKSPATTLGVAGSEARGTETCAEWSFYLVHDRRPDEALPAYDPYRSTDGHPSIGGHLLFVQEGEPE